MNLDRTQFVAGVGLLALLPVVAYAAIEGMWPVVLALLNVLLIAGGLYYMLSPTEHEGDHAAGH
ncbi:hypothetical protein [Haloarchaeobius sp. DYHT-AS-18]|uniref:hypothetical protein n=1 Tax=Haloarchaeobius sp. DYHT-AS-18 TaxID=3446117 RepID=UPI003EBD5897